MDPERTGISQSGSSTRNATLGGIVVHDAALQGWEGGWGWQIHHNHRSTVPGMVLLLWPPRCRNRNSETAPCLLIFCGGMLLTAASFSLGTPARLVSYPHLLFSFALFFSDS